MKKTVLVAAALATLAVSSSASALDVGFVRVLQVDAFCGVGVASCGIGLSLGALAFTPLGSDGLFCDYLGNWISPFNPNDVGICVLHELRTAFAPSCIVNEAVDVVTTLTAGGGIAGADICQGFNLKGEGFNDVSLLLTEGCGTLQGIAAFNSCGVPQVYPIHAI